METFWVIKTINKDGTRGYVMDTPQGIIIIQNGVTAEVTQFKTYQDAQQFIRERKIERQGIKAYIRDNNDLMKDENLSYVTASKPVYHLENQKGEKLYYESRNETYFFKMVDVGYPIFNAEKQCREFVKHYEFQQSQIFMVKHSGKDIPEERTLIQVYGTQKKEDGTMEEPKHYEINEVEIENETMKNKKEYRIKFINPTEGVLSGVLFGHNMFASVPKHGSSHSIEVIPDKEVPYSELLLESKNKPFKVTSTTINSDNMVQCVQCIMHKNITKEPQPLHMVSGVKQNDGGQFTSTNTEEYTIDGNGYLQFPIMSKTTAEIVVTIEQEN